MPPFQSHFAGSSRDTQVAWMDSPVEGLSYAPLAARNSAESRHALTIDLEDWQQSVYDGSLPVSDRFHHGTDRILGILDRHGVKATFFVLGNVAEHSPDLVRRLQRCGHELQTHGYDHTEIGRRTPRQFREDVVRARSILEDLLGEPVTGYRAPRFSITGSTAWALDVLADEGFRYDSSIFPLRVRGYGIGGWCPAPHRIRTRCGAELIEVPVATVTVFGRRLPVGGGGYFRLLPYRLIRRALRQMERVGQPAVIYCHPHEFDPDGIWETPFRVPLRQRLHQGLGRGSFTRKIERMVRDFAFGPVSGLLPPSVARSLPPRVT